MRSPYDFIRKKRLTIVVAADVDAAQHVIVTKGAFANMLAICSSVDRDGVDVPLTTDLQEGLCGFLQDQRVKRGSGSSPWQHGQSRRKNTTSTVMRTG